MADRKTIYIPADAQRIIDNAPGSSLSSKISGIIIRYGEIIAIRPDLAITSSDAVKERLTSALS